MAGFVFQVSDQPHGLVRNSLERSLKVSFFNTLYLCREGEVRSDVLVARDQN